LKDVQEVTRHSSRLRGIATIECGLTAAGLSRREIDLVAQALEHFGHCDSNLGKDLIDNAGHE
jgi:hypothetical protein